MHGPDMMSMQAHLGAHAEPLAACFLSVQRKMKQALTCSKDLLISILLEEERKLTIGLH